MTPDEFKAALRKEGIEPTLEKYIFEWASEHVSQHQLARIITAVAETFRLTPVSVQAYVVGSAKLGFSISEKRLKNGSVLPRYRPFNEISDIDVAIIAPGAFDKIWQQLSAYSNRQFSRPWRSERLGDYLLTGWLRPDHFPKNVRLDQCDAWNDCFRKLSSVSEGRRKIRGGLFHSKEHMRQYYRHAISECHRSEELTR